MKVSIIIPCFNASLYIQDCIGSVINQTYKNIEIICIDDGSTDNTVKIINDFIKNSTLDIKLLLQKNNGAPSARNKGIRESIGEYIQFLDADDILSPDKIEHQISLVNKTSFPDLIVGSYVRKNMLGVPLFVRKYVPERNMNVWLKLMNTDLGNTCSNLFKADLFQKNIAWDEKLESSQEYDLMFKILQIDPTIIFDPKNKTIVRVRNSGSISQTNIALKWERYVKLRVDIVSYLECNEPGVITPQFYQSLFNALRMLYPFNSKVAVDFFKKKIPKNFIPTQSPNISKSYIFVFKILGFKLTEEIKKATSPSNAS
ncbi:MAG: glycosyltransferase family 2 protein [Marinicellaceae bacterium]